MKLLKRVVLSFVHCWWGSNCRHEAILLAFACLQISHGADVNLRNQEHQTPYDLATVSKGEILFCRV